MAGTNRELLKAHIDNHMEKVIWPRIRKNGIEYCNTMCRKAIQSRESAPNSHDFTGNLLNSIVAAMYEDKQFVYASYASDNGIAPPIQVEMTQKKGRYYFKVDYRGAKSSYSPEVKTKGTYGQDDAKKFVQSYKPKTKAKFEIVIAYTTAYATFVDMVRQTTGISLVYEQLASTASQELGK